MSGTVLILRYLGPCNNTAGSNIVRYFMVLLYQKYRVAILRPRDSPIQKLSVKDLAHCRGMTSSCAIIFLVVLVRISSTLAHDISGGIPNDSPTIKESNSSMPIDQISKQMALQICSIIRKAEIPADKAIFKEALLGPVAIYDPSSFLTTKQLLKDDVINVIYHKLSLKSCLLSLKRS